VNLVLKDGRGVCSLSEVYPLMAARARLTRFSSAIWSCLNVRWSILMSV